MGVVGLNGQPMGTPPHYERALTNLRKDNDELRAQMGAIRDAREAVTKYISELQKMLEIAVDSLQSMARAQIGAAEDALAEIAKIRPDFFGEAPEEVVPNETK